MTNVEKKAFKRLLKDQKRVGGSRVMQDAEDRLRMGLMSCDKVCMEDDGESWKVYGFIKPNDILYYFDNPNDLGAWERYMSLTNDDIHEFVNDCMVVNIFSDYDCTGRSFTRYVHWHRNPCGLISYVHAMTIDV